MAIKNAIDKGDSSVTQKAMQALDKERKAENYQACKAWLAHVVSE